MISRSSYGLLKVVDVPGHQKQMKNVKYFNLAWTRDGGDI
jgi:hypothetical protein